MIVIPVSPVQVRYSPVDRYLNIMPSRSKISQLPSEIQEELNRKLVENGFSNHEGLESWLNDNGFQISRSSIQRHSQEFEKKLAALKLATDQAKAVVDGSPDDEGAMSEALIRLMQQKAFDTLINLSGDQDISLSALGRMIADLSRASIGQKKFMEEVKAKLKAELGKLEAQAGKNGEIKFKAVEESIGRLWG